MANDSNPGLFGGFQFPGLQMPAFSQTSLTDNPVMNTLTGSMDFMKNLWGASGNSLGSMAGFVAPTLDIEQIDRKITDLKAVEGWLHTNATMLRATIQALEVQRNTIVTLQSFSNLAAQQAQAGAGGSAEPTSNTVSPTWPMPPQGAQRGASDPFAPGVRVPEPDPDDMLDEDDEDDDAPPEAPVAAEAAPVPPAKRTTAKGKRDGATADAADESLAQSAALAGQATSASIQNATAWWNMLQDQFAKVAHAAVASTKTPAKAAGAKSAAAKSGGATPATKPAKKSVAQPAPRKAAAKTGAVTPTKKAPAKKAGAKKSASPKAAAAPQVAKPAPVLPRKSGSKP